MGSRPYFHILLIFFILSVKFDSLMSEKNKPKPSLCERRTISFDADLYLLAQRRMKEEGETMFSRYVQTLVRRDTALLRAEALNSEKAILNFAMAAETTEAGPELSQDKAKGKYQTAAKTRAERGAGAKMAKLSENLDCGSSTPTKKNSRRAG